MAQQVAEAAHFVGPGADIEGMVNDAREGNAAFGRGDMLGALGGYGSAAMAIPMMALPGSVKDVKAGVKALSNALPMDEASRMARASDMGFKDVELYNGAGADIPAFDLSMGGSTSRSPVGKLGVSASYDPETASEFASLAARGGEGQNIMPLRYRSAKEGVITLDSSMGNLEIAGAVQDAWDAGYIARWC